jgi:regulator of replication initiation timing
MAREADFYTPSEAANLLGLAEFTILGLLTSGELEGRQDEQGRWWIPAAAVDAAVKRSRDASPRAPSSADPSVEETIPITPVSNGPQGREDTTTQSEEGDIPGGNQPDVSADVRGGSGWVTTRVAAQALGVDPRTVRTYINRGELVAKVEGKGVDKTYFVAIDSLHALRVRRESSRKTRSRVRENSGRVNAGAEGVEDLAAVVRDLTDRLIHLSSETAELRTRLELTVRAESTLQEERDRLRQDWERERQEHQAAQEEAQRLREELQAERSKGFWQRLFGG